MKISQIKNIDWRNIPITELSNEEWDNQIKALNEAGVRRIEARKGCYMITDFNKLINSYYVYFGPNYAELYFFSDKFGLKRCYNGRVQQRIKENAEVKGYKSLMTIKNDFYKETKVRTDKAFGYDLSLCRKIKQCVPGYLNYSNSIFARKFLKNVCKADISSAFPFQLSKDLPTLEDCKIIKGKAEPTEEYPFAFYINSHHLAIYNELKTEDFITHKYKGNLDVRGNEKRYNIVSPEDEETILCKRSDYKLDKVMRKYYDGRKTNEEYKAIMNTGIGAMHMNTRPEMAHIAAISIARYIYQIQSLAQKLDNEGKFILCIMTDSIAWLGGESKVPTTIKDLGNFVSEYVNADFVYTGAKAYQIKKDNIIKTSWSGKKKDKEDFEWGDILKYELDIETVYISKETCLHIYK